MKLRFTLQSCADEKWGDWRPHLSMILSNLIDNDDLDVKSITSLGDSLGKFFKFLYFSMQYVVFLAFYLMGLGSSIFKKNAILVSKH